jgi:hypothetical protein
VGASCYAGWWEWLCPPLSCNYCTKQGVAIGAKLGGVVGRTRRRAKSQEWCVMAEALKRGLVTYLDDACGDDEWFGTDTP